MWTSLSEKSTFCFGGIILKKYISLLLVIVMCFSLASCAGRQTESQTDNNTITVTDMAGREVQVPKDTKSTTIASTYGVATPFLSTLNLSDRVVACNFKNKSFYRLCDEVIVGTGNIGTTNTLDQEALATINPSVYICRISDTPKIEIAATLGIPSITLSAETPEEVMKAYTMFGQIFGVEARAKEINDYIQGELDEIDALAATIKEDDKITAICLGSRFSRIAGEDMIQTIMLKRIGAKTLVDGVVGKEERYWADCGVEKVFELNPEYIFVTSSTVLDYKMGDFYEDSAWSAVSAVKTHSISQIPAKFDSWDMPGPGFILAMYYMMNRLYPDKVPNDMLQEKIDNYYSFLYGRTFTGDEIGYSF